MEQIENTQKQNAATAGASTGVSTNAWLTGIAAILFVSIVFWAGYAYGQGSHADADRITSVINKDADKPSNVDFNIFWRAWNILNEKFVANGSTTDQKKVWGAIEGLAQSLGDPYTVFMPPEEAKIFNTQIQGNFEGVGMEIGLRDKILTVVAPIKDSPAFKAGVKAGDRVLKIDGKSTENMSVEAAVKLIRGQKGTTVTINFFREGKKAPFDLKIVRDTINLPTLDSEMRKDGIFVIRLYSFNAQSGKLFNDALKEFAKTNGKKLIIDLRNNPGGYLETAIDIASRFLPEGTTVVSERYRDKPEDIRQAIGGQLFDKSLKTIVLINEGSASASEILAGTLRENDAAVLVGAKSFGKGSVQELVKLTSDTNLKVTIARWYTPKGNTISEKGIVPDHEVKFDPEAFEKNGKDTQMEKAVQLLLQSK